MNNFSGISPLMQMSSSSRNGTFQSLQSRFVQERKQHGSKIKSSKLPILLIWFHLLYLCEIVNVERSYLKSDAESRTKSRTKVWKGQCFVFSLIYLIETNASLSCALVPWGSEGTLTLFCHLRASSSFFFLASSRREIFEVSAASSVACRIQNQSGHVWNCIGAQNLSNAPM